MTGSWPRQKGPENPRRNEHTSFCDHLTDAAAAASDQHILSGLGVWQDCITATDLDDRFESRPKASHGVEGCAAMTRSTEKVTKQEACNQEATPKRSASSMAQNPKQTLPHFKGHCKKPTGSNGVVDDHNRDSKVPGHKINKVGFRVL